MPTVSAQELVVMYQNLMKDYKKVKDLYERVADAHEKNKKILDKSIISLEQQDTMFKKQIKELENIINIQHDVIKSKQQVIDSLLSQSVKNTKPVKNTCGVESVGDLNDYEYVSDGKRMCFRNYHTGNYVYAGDKLFHVLKNRMLNGE